MSHGTTRKDSPDTASIHPRPHPGESRISRIARRAHEIYRARGGAHDKALEDWLQAEREIDAEMDGERDQS
jgi:hypothetical protein